jgi:AbrB family looped-hinge helix DNA binding protein
MSSKTTLDRFGRVLIPKNVRSEIGISPGTQLKIEVHAKGLLLKPVHGEPNVTSKEGVLVFSCTPAGDIVHAIQKHREERFHVP